MQPNSSFQQNPPNNESLIQSTGNLTFPAPVPHFPKNTPSFTPLNSETSYQNTPQPQLLNHPPMSNSQQSASHQNPLNQPPHNSPFQPFNPQNTHYLPPATPHMQSMNFQLLPSYQGLQSLNHQAHLQKLPNIPSFSPQNNQQFMPQFSTPDRSLLSQTNLLMPSSFPSTPFMFPPPNPISQTFSNPSNMNKFNSQSPHFSPSNQHMAPRYANPIPTNLNSMNPNLGHSVSFSPSFTPLNGNNFYPMNAMPIQSSFYLPPRNANLAATQKISATSFKNKKKSKKNEDSEEDDEEEEEEEEWSEEEEEDFEEFEGEDSDSDYGAPRKRASRAKPPSATNTTRSDVKEYPVHRRPSGGSENSSEEEWSSSKKQRAQAKKKRISRKSEDEEEFGAFDAVRFSSRSRNVQSYHEDLAAADEWALEVNEDEESNEPVIIEDEGDVIEAVLDYRVATFEPSEEHQEDEEEVDDVTEYLIKWKGRSHLYNTWQTVDSVIGLKGFKKLENFRHRLSESLMYRNNPSTTKEEIENIDINREMERDQFKDYVIVDRIISKREVEADLNEEEFDGGVEYLCKWKRLPYSEATWEPADTISPDFQTEIDAFLDRSQSQKVPYKSAHLVKNRPNFKPFTSQPDFISGGTLRDYQLLGVNWMSYLWSRNENGILADEMGLGKTVQSISFLNYLFQSQQLYGPFLIIVPLSTIGAWQNEFFKWAPEMNLLVYTGDSSSRQIIRDYEFYGDEGKTKIKFNALLTTFELILKDRAELGRIRWAHLLVDEAHRLKNAGSQLYEALKDFHTNNRILITGTPLQNSVKELVALVRFIMPDKFQEFEGFEIDVSATNQEDKIKDLQEKLKPYMLRRLKKDVEKSLPTKTERILRVELSTMQLEYYKGIYARNFASLKSSGATGHLSLLNICMELKKASNHPYLFDGAETMSTVKDEQLRGMIMNSGKMVLLDKLLARLKEGGHRVLIFSQMVRMLDILHDYLVFRGYPHQRLDGSVSSELRKRAMEHFNKENSPDFVFLLSTRAGGLGLNLYTADTVIIFDSDWNPQNGSFPFIVLSDLQAMARAHRIGQTKVVNVYRFVSKDTIEEEIIERAKRKMVLEYCIIKQMDTTQESIMSKSKIPNVSTTNISKEELQTILKFGAQNLFKQHEVAIKENAALDSTHSNKLEALDLDDILARAEHTDTSTTEPGGAADGGSEFLEQWRVADFGVNQLNWDEIIPEKERVTAVTGEDLEFIGGRRRTTVMSSQVGAPKDSEVKSKRPTKRKKVGTSTEMKEQDVRALVRSMLKYGNIDERFDDIIEDAVLTDKVPLTVTKTAQEIIEKCHEAVALKRDESNPSNEIVEKIEKIESTESTEKIEVTDQGQVIEATVKVEKLDKQKAKPISITYQAVSVNPVQLIGRLSELSCLNRRMEDQLTTKGGILSFRLTSTLKPITNWTCIWGQKEDAMLLVGIWKHGLGNWDAMQTDLELGFRSKFFLAKVEKEGVEVDEKDKLLPKALHLQRRAEYLLKVFEEEDARAPKKKTKPVPVSTPKKKKSSKRDIDDFQGGEEEVEEDMYVSDEYGDDEPKKKKLKKEKPKLPLKKGPKRSTAGNLKKTMVFEEPKEPKPKRTKATKPKPAEASSSYESMDEEECKRAFRPLKHQLKVLRDQTTHMADIEKAKFLRETITKIGDHIESVKSEPNQLKDPIKSERDLWKFASYFWPTRTSSSSIKNMYLKIVNADDHGDVKSNK